MAEHSRGGGPTGATTEWLRRALVALCLVAPGCATKGIDGATHFLCRSDAECTTDEACVETQCVPRTTGTAAENFPIPPAPQPLQWAACTEPELAGAECAMMQVPLDYAHPEGETLQIALARLVASDPARRIGSLLLNDGGPGVASRGMVTNWRNLVANDGPYQLSYAATPEVLARFDLIGIDPRGVGASVPLVSECGDPNAQGPMDFTPDDDIERQGFERAMQSFADDCFARHGRILAFIDSHSVARDMDQVRRALGEDRISYYGKGYGSLPGTAYAELFPDHVRAFVFDGGLKPNLDGISHIREQAANEETVFVNFARDCTARPDCAARFPAFGGDIRAAFDAAARRADVTPLVDPSTGAVVTQNQFDMQLQAMIELLPASGSILETFVEAASKGQGFGLAEPNSRSASLTAFRCADENFPDARVAFDQLVPGLLAAAPRFTPGFFAKSFPCLHWPYASQPHPVAHAPGAPPILVIGATGDPNTPYSWSERLASELDSGVLLTRDGPGHVRFNQCVVDTSSAYLVDLTVPADGTVCPSP